MITNKSLFVASSWSHLYLLNSAILVVFRHKGRVALVGDRLGTYRVLVGTADVKYHLEDLGLDGKKLLKWIFKKWNGESWTGFCS